eukprot:g3430.t1
MPNPRALFPDIVAAETAAKLAEEPDLLRRTRELVKNDPRFRNSGPSAVGQTYVRIKSVLVVEFGEDSFRAFKDEVSRILQDAVRDASPSKDAKVAAEPGPANASDGASSAAADSNMYRTPTHGETIRSMKGEAARVLIGRINSDSPIMSLAALRLFGSLLDLNVPLVMRSLVSNGVRSWKPDRSEESPLRTFLGNALASETHVEEVEASEKEDAEAVRLGCAARTFLAMFNDHEWPKTSEKGFSAYLYDAQVRSVAFQCSGTFGWQIVAAMKECAAAAARNDGTKEGEDDDSPDESPTDSGDVFERKEFVDAIFLKLDRFMDISIEEAIELTGVVSKLALCLDHQSFCFFFRCPKQVSKNDTRSRSLVTVLQNLWIRATEHSKTIDNFKRHVASVRAHLGICADNSQFDESDTVTTSRGDAGRNQFVTAYVVLVELLKEIAAILQATESLVTTEKRQIRWALKRGRLSSDVRYELP